MVILYGIVEGNAITLDTYSSSAQYIFYPSMPVWIANRKKREKDYCCNSDQICVTLSNHELRQTSIKHSTTKKGNNPTLIHCYHHGSKTHKRLKRTLFSWTNQDKTWHFRGSPLFQETLFLFSLSLLLYIAWKRGLRRKFARFVLFCPIRKLSL